MKLHEFEEFIETLQMKDAEYINTHLSVIKSKMQVNEVIKLQNLYNTAISSNEPLDMVGIHRDMKEWCIKNCKGAWLPITMSNWAFELTNDAMLFRLVWDRSSYN